MGSSPQVKQFFEINNDNDDVDVTALISTTKILIKLITNARKKTPDDEAEEDSNKFRRVRLNNPKIQQSIVSGPVLGGVDILLCAGFTITKDGNNGDMLLYNNDDDHDSNNNDIVHDLESGLAVLLQQQQQQQKRKSSTSNTTTTTTTTTVPTTPFLSDEERHKRQQEAKLKRKLRKQEKLLALERFQEDKKERDEIASRQTALKQNALLPAHGNNNNTNANGTGTVAAASAFAPGPNISIKRHRKDPPTEEVAAAGAPSAAAAAAAATAQDGTVTSAATTTALQEYREIHRRRCRQGKDTKMSLRDHNNDSDEKDAMMVEDDGDDDVDNNNRDDDNEDRKMAAVSEKEKVEAEADQKMSIDDNEDSNMKKECRSSSKITEAYNNDLNTTIPSCASAEGIRDTSVYFRNSSSGNLVSSSSSSSPQCLRKLLRELDGMKDGLLPSNNDPRCPIWVRFDEETPQYIRAVISAALPGPTPYSGGLFCFDMYIPPSYPNEPPRVTLLTTGGGSVRFGPNLYSDGKVCLSLLGTWPGPKWNPKISNLTQVLISIQGMLLGEEHPYFLEPSHGGWEGWVKSSDFASKGQSTSGLVVSEDIHLPIEAAVYEDSLRVGTIRYAMLEMIQAATTDFDGESSLAAIQFRYLRPFQLAILAHFHQNRDGILSELQNWINIDRTIASKSAVKTQMQPLQSQSSARLGAISGQLKKLYRALESRLLKLQEPNLSAVSSLAAAAAAAPQINEQHDDDDDDDDDGMEVSLPNVDERKPSATVKTEDVSADGDDCPLVYLNDLMQKAATGGDYVKDGKLQAAIKAIEDLKKSMKEAAEQGNFIRAGKLQEQLNARIAAIQDLPDEFKKESLTMKELMGTKEKGKTPAMAAIGFPPTALGDGTEMDHSDEEDFDDNDDDEEEGVAGGMPPGMLAAGQGPKNWFPPANQKNRYGNPKHQWGGGRELKSESTMQAMEDSGSKLPASKPRSGVPSRLRIRLPNSNVIMEDFDATDTIVEIYRRIDPHIQRRSDSASGGSASGTRHAVAPKAKRSQVATPYGTAMVPAPTFSEPLSLKGYTLVLAYPKREFSLEMHGTKSLREMDLVPSASITVMLCEERGMVRRGDLESRLAVAQGDAMDIEGLSYEGLQELTERVGASEITWRQEDELNLERNSVLLCPSEHLANDGATGGNVQCPICLGEFDKNDEARSLRTLKTCIHSDNTFHEACLRTWLKAHTSCPICKTSLLG